MSRRVVLIGSAIVALAALVGLVALTLGPAPRAKSVAIAEPTANIAPTSTPSPIVTTVASVSAKPPASVVVAAASASGSVDPDDDGAWKTLKPGDIMAGDLFESDEGAPPLARKMRNIGTITVGVMNEAKVHDEHALAAALVKVGGELDAYDRGNKLAPDKRTEAHTAILEKHRAALMPLVSGRVVLRGVGYVLTLDPVKDRKWGDAGG